MIFSFLQKIFGSPNERILKPFKRIVGEINAFESILSKLSDAELQAQTPKLKERLQKGETLDHILPEAFATVREASIRVLKMRHFDVQLLGGIVLHKGMIAEMQTGEGKTLVATLPTYLNALSGKGVHVVTVNDYLARRDSEWMGQLHSFLGLSIGCIVPKLNDSERKAAYGADITYGTNNEFGFDYLRDNMKFKLQDMVQREFNYAIVDEVDSILIDEARTPLIISGAAEDSSQLYTQVDVLIPRLQPGDYEKDEKARSVTLTDAGTEHIEELLKSAGVLTQGTLYDVPNVSLVHHVNQALRAHHLFTRDVDYIVKDNKVIIIDEFTGRMMEGRRYSEGLHQALEAKERAHIQMENQTLASITFQNYFRMYEKLSGMTGTAMTEAAEFESIYKLHVVSIPTNVPCIRKDSDDEVYRTAAEKYNAMITHIEESYKKKQPVLVGTVSIEKSELLSTLLKQKNLPHHVLNARYHEQEAFIISQAGRAGAITIATNMAGRGTDIQLGGNIEMRIKQELSGIEDPKEFEKRKNQIIAEVAAEKEIVKQAGGLCVMGTERHESRRIDNQLRGRSGRQGDQGASRFFLSLDDELMRIFGSDRMDSVLQRLGLKEGEAISHPWINKALERAQKRVEARNFEIRKQLLKYDDVMNDQRKVIYEQRKDLMSANDISPAIRDMEEQVIEDIIILNVPKEGVKEKGVLKSLHEECLRLLKLDLPVDAWEKDHLSAREIESRINKALREKMAQKEVTYGAKLMRLAEKSIVLQLLDQLWKDHLLSLDHLRQGINLRAYAQRDPLNEYKHESFMLFETMLKRLRDHTVGMLTHMELSETDPEEIEDAYPEAPQKVQEIHGQDIFEGDEEGSDQDDQKPKTIRHATGQVDPNDPNTWGKVQRNSPCPCGSGEKYKNCHGREN
ncbi:MAG: preprotein translocase subunit SecA [Alphaproteobacteria bacterium]|nr:preprotein translocase subunit SecA [Alphaproteobacteria bacterium]